MSVLLRQLARYIAEKAASNPVVREKAAKIAHGVVDEARQVAREDDRACAAGQAVRRAWSKLRDSR